MLEYIIAVAAAVIFGAIFSKVAKIELSKRCEDERQVKKLNKPYITPLWILLTVIFFALVTWRVDTISTRVTYMIYFLVALNISAIDQLVRKIPNELLLVMLVTKIVSMPIDIFVNHQEVKDVVYSSLVGMFIGYVVCVIPGMIFAKYIGNGDVKYSAVIGLAFGLAGYFETAIVLGVCSLICWIVLKATKKGDGKTATPMGPFLSIGIVLTMLVPLTSVLPNTI